MGKFYTYTLWSVCLFNEYYDEYPCNIDCVMIMICVKSSNKKVDFDHYFAHILFKRVQRNPVSFRDVQEMSQLRLSIMRMA